MKAGAFKTHINSCWQILKQLEMDAEFIPNPSYPDSPRAYFKGMSYQNIWKACLQNRYYHFQLFDNSLIYYGYQSPESFSISYYEFPYAAESYFEFINSFGLVYSEVGEELKEEYDDYLTTCDSKQSISSIRYDVSYDQYVEARHPVSHLHIGHETNIRIRTERIMGPLSFLYFLLRQHYPDKWMAFIDGKKAQTISNIVRDSLEVVSVKYVSELDNCEIVLR